MFRKLFAILLFLLTFQFLSLLGENGVYLLIGYLKPISDEFLHNLIAGIQLLNVLWVYIAYRVAKTIWVK